jgi:hypothetical protein
MRAFLLCLAASSLLAADSGVPLRPSPTDYAVQGQAPTVKIAAEVLPPNQVSKMFSPYISKQFIVVEVAIYPLQGVRFDVESRDFSLRVGKKIGRADRPLDVAPWPERRDTGRRLPVDVTAEAGITYEHGNDPYSNDAQYGRRSGVGTYTGVAVSAPAQPDYPPPPDPRTDPRVVYDKVQRWALAEGDTKAAVAGYLYFPQYAKHKKSDEIELKFAKDDASVNLVFPK